MKNRPQRLMVTPLLVAGAGLTATIAGCFISNPMMPEPPVDLVAYCGDGSTNSTCDMAGTRDGGVTDGGAKD